MPITGTAEATKVCKFCAEDIKAAAILCRHCGKDQPNALAPISKKTKKGLGLLGWLGIAMVVLMVIGALNAGHDQTTEPAKPLTAAEKLKADIQAHPIVVKRSDWRKVAFNTASEWTVTLHNRSAHPVGNVKYETDYASETGINVNHKNGILERIIKPHATRTFVFNDGFVDTEAVRAGFDITEFEFLDQKKDN